MASNNKYIKRIAISTHRPCNPTIIKRVEEWAVKWTVEAEDAVLTVIFVFIRRPTWDFNDGIDFLGCIITDWQ
jgi:hypothetical protein